jgi:hypothetical protein
VDYYNKIEISKDKAGKVVDAMRFIRYSLSKSDFDTVAIRKYRIECEIDNTILYSIDKNINRDSVRDSVVKNFDFSFWQPTVKSISKFPIDGSISLNDRQISNNNLNEFKKNIMQCNELKNLSVQERKRFAKECLFLFANDIWDAVLYYGGKPHFLYSCDGIYGERLSARYLVLEEDTLDNSFLDDKILIDRQKPLLLYRERP